MTSVSGAGAFIHPTSIVEDGAVLGERVRIGPFCHVGPEVRLGDGVELVSYVTIQGATEIGAGTRIYPHAALGHHPQDLKYKGQRTTLSIGRNCQLREGFTAHIGTETGRGHTSIGDNCFLMAYSHVAHDCAVGSNVIIANGSVMGGHCQVGDGVVISGLVALHQFVRVGRGAMISGGSMVAGDVIPYGMAQGDRAMLRGLNVVGLRRAGAGHGQIAELRQAYRMLFDRAGAVASNIERVREAYAGNARVAEILDFMTVRGKRIFTVPAVGETGVSGEPADE